MDPKTAAVEIITRVFASCEFKSGEKRPEGAQRGHLVEAGYSLQALTGWISSGGFAPSAREVFLAVRDYLESQGVDVT